MRRVVVTGASGFVGRRLVKVLHKRDFNVTTLGRKPAQDEKHLVVGDNSWTAANLARILENSAPRILFHFAGSTAGTPAELERANVELTATLLQGLRQTGLRPLLVLAGSAAEYGSGVVEGVPVEETTICSPLTVYGKSKLEQSRAFLDYGEATDTPVLVARIFNPIGAGMPTHLALGAFAAQIAAVKGARGEIRTGNIDVMRDFLDVEHVAAMICDLTGINSARGVVNICSGKGTSLRELLGTMISLSGKIIDVVTEPSRVRPFEPKIIVGSTKRLAQLGRLPPKTCYTAVIEGILTGEAGKSYHRQ
jgi:GDP-4-dehydro-6-deoxy-D-mannose reductase